MIEIFGLPLPAIAGQVMLGLVNGCFYAVLSLGLAVIFGLLRIVNFAHGAFFTLGAFGAWMLHLYLGAGYWVALLVVPLAVGAFGGVSTARKYRARGFFGSIEAARRKASRAAAGSGSRCEA